MHPAGLFWPLSLEEIHHESMAIPVVPLPVMVGRVIGVACLLIPALFAFAWWSFVVY